MRTVIIGGGIAGITLGVFLEKKNIDVVICEKSVGMPNRGHAFLMHQDGLTILKEMINGSNAVLPGKNINAFSLRRPDDREIKYLQLNNWKCIKRVDLIRFLNSLFPSEKIKEGRTFSHFIYDKGKATAAVFTNGEVEYGDIFVGADGGDSKVRDAILGKVKFSPVKVKEIVGVAHIQKTGKPGPNVFTKYISDVRGLAFGTVPVSEGEFVWFLQYDPTISDVTDHSAEGLQTFCKSMLRKFPEHVHDILDNNNFGTSYVWNTHDFEPLHTFHNQNVVLIGDAAHLSLPFTSAGTTNAIIDAKVLVEALLDSADYKKAYSQICKLIEDGVSPDVKTLNTSVAATINYEKAFEKLYETRITEITNHIAVGRKLREEFLSPVGQDEDLIPVPLINTQKQASPITKNKPIQIQYFTDPVCSTCWILQPLVRKLELEYAGYIDIDYRMGGLLPSWKDYNSGKINKPSDAAKHWEEVCILHEMPIDGDVWIEDPLASSYPPSIAFKAAQMQDPGLANLFLRRIREMVFLEKKNIIKREYLEQAAFEVGLDAARLMRDFEGKAKDSFKNDLELAAKLGVTSFPTMFFASGTNKINELKGFQPYENFEAIIHKLFPSARKETINTDPENLFALFPTMTDKEFAFLSNTPKESAIMVLTALYERGSIEKYESKNGIIWKSKFAA